MSQSGNTLSASGTVVGEVSGPAPYTLNGVVNGRTVSFTTLGPIGVGVQAYNIINYRGTIDGNTIRGDLDGSVYVGRLGEPPDVLVTWMGTFTVTIEK